MTALDFIVARYSLESAVERGDYSRAAEVVAEDVDRCVAAMRGAL